ncbi:hypothetical protein RMATCC62417_01387 [Rhizopus microsporus]|nr:hypothetical protein RMATCC62417_01387 [Rhizopus microsporus]
MRFDFLSIVIVFLALFATVFAAHDDHASSSQVAAPSTTSSAQAAATATAGSGHEGVTTTTTTTVKKTVGNFDSPPVLMDGTLFWISLGISCGLWTTGKFIDVKIQRQERYAESRVHAL